jgi:hypothetical protein
VVVDGEVVCRVGGFVERQKRDQARHDDKYLFFVLSARPAAMSFHGERSFSADRDQFILDSRSEAKTFLTLEAESNPGIEATTGGSPEADRQIGERRRKRERTEQKGGTQGVKPRGCERRRPRIKRKFNS